MTKSEELIAEIQEELAEAAAALSVARDFQEKAIDAILEGNFIGGLSVLGTVTEEIEDAKSDEKKAAKLLVKLIPQMHADGFADEIIYGVVETLIGEFLGA
ncbi:hypothetical protein [Desulfosporosinus sp. SB140]|uniref:hypothetical protein n=1 Tax=Desulfosporosinus paludis TaxID=3115649 RepID=UPI00388F7390